jgi:hypothetical protein
MASSTNLAVEAVTNIVQVVTNTVWVSAPPQGGVALKDFIPFVTALLGALTGALAAFSLGLLKQRRDRQDERHATLLEAQFALFSQWTILSGIYEDKLKPHKDNPERHGAIPIFNHFEVHLKAPVSELGFLIDSDAPNLIQDIHQCEIAYLNVKILLKEHSTLREELGQKYKTETFDLSTGISTRPINAEDYYKIRTLTDNLYEQIEFAIPKLEKDLQTITDFIKRNFKDKNALDASATLSGAETNT